MSRSHSWSVDIEKKTIANKYWRNVLFTGKHLQVVVMSVPPREELDWEIHKDTDQFFRIEEGNGYVEIETAKNQVKRIKVKDGSAVVIPAGTWHNVINSSRSKALKFYTIYAPPHHPRRRRNLHK